MTKLAFLRLSMGVLLLNATLLLMTLLGFTAVVGQTASNLQMRMPRSKASKLTLTVAVSGALNQP